MKKDLTIYLPGGCITPPENPYGRLIANYGLYKAMYEYGGYESIHFQTARNNTAQSISSDLSSGRGERTIISEGSPDDVSHAIKSGTLLSGQPYLKDLAWTRRSKSNDSAYSIIGSIFAFASPRHREEMMFSTMAPLQEWDALICSSPKLEIVVSNTFDEWEDYLRERFGAKVIKRPKLPVIPIGVEVERVIKQATNISLRKKIREENNIHDDEIVILFLGRLSFYDKSFPQATFRAIGEAQKRTGIKTHLIMAGWFPDKCRDRKRFVEIASAYALDLNVIYLDGNDKNIVAQCWAGADIFISLSDTVLETFGQAPVEAMAAGLPVVMSDWNGYEYIARDGVDGFLIPTLGAEHSQIGETLATLESMNSLPYANYMGSIAQHTAVHVELATQALTNLIKSPELRRKMGEAGKRRAIENFSWGVVTKKYIETFDELSEIRLQHEDIKASIGLPRKMNPLRNDPFYDYRVYPSMVITPGLIIYLEQDAEKYIEVVLKNSTIELDGMFAGFRARSQECSRILDILENGARISVEDLSKEFPSHRRPFIRMTLMWLMKRGVISWIPKEKR